MTEDQMRDEFEHPYFTPYLLAQDPYPAGFEDWVAKITQFKYTIHLPDGTHMNAHLFMDKDQVWEAGNYTKYLLNRYDEL